MATGIGVFDPILEDNVEVGSFIANMTPLVPLTDVVDFIFEQNVHTETINIADGATVGLGLRMNATSELVINGIISAYTTAVAPPASLDFFLEIIDTYESMKTMIFPLGTATLLDAAFNQGSNRVYSAVKVALPFFGAIGLTHSYTMRTYVKLPSAWSGAGGVNIAVSILGYPVTYEYFDPEG